MAGQLRSVETRTSWDGDDTITVRQIIDLYSRIGLPHFQRGRVWGNDSIAAFLESLFHNTPCGSFVFWSSTDNRANGVPIDSSTSTPLEYLVIDGQQRIRSVHDAWKDVPGSEEDDTRSKKVWCINLSRVPRLAPMLEQSKKTPTLFVWAPDPASERTKVQARRMNLIPFSAIRANDSWSGLAAYHSLVRTRDEKQQKQWDISIDEEYASFRSQVLAMQGRTFFVAHRDAKSSLAQMAELYNRINAGGKQVETEERAFAALVGLQPEHSAVADGLRRAFGAVHGESLPATDRDALLKREEERQFGFKLFIRIFVQICQYHCGHDLGKSSFTFDVVGKDSFREAFGARTRDDVDALWDETLAVTQTIHQVLGQELNCDDLRMLPDAAGLLPVAQLLIQYPSLRERRYRPLLAALTLRIVLAAPDSREWSRWIATAGDPTHNAVQTVGQLYGDVSPRARRRFDAALRSSESSLQDRYVLLLYWLQRKHRVADFCGDCIPDARSRVGLRARSLSKDATAEKGHLIPRSKLARIYGTDVRPTESHEINSVGNLTYMSYDFNRALGDECPNLVPELEQARENLAPHFVSDEGPHRLYRRFQKLSQLIHQLEDTNEHDFEQAREKIIAKFRKLSSLRREAIRDSFEAWLQELDVNALASLGLKNWEAAARAGAGSPRLEPQKPRFATQEQFAHLVRDLGLPDEAEDHVLGLIRERRPRPPKDGAIRVQLTDKLQVSIAVSRSGVTLHLRRLTEQLRKGTLRAVGLPNEPGNEFALDPVPQFDALIRFCEQNADKFASAHSQAEEGRSVARTATKRARLASEVEFWAMVRKRAPEAEVLVRRLLEPFRRAGFDLEPGEGSLKVRSFRTGSDFLLPMFFIKKRGGIEFWPKTFTRRAGQAGIGPKLAADYVAGMRRLLSGGEGGAYSSRVQDTDIPALQALVLGFHQQSAQDSGEQ